MIIKLYQWLWRLLPDKCEMPDCPRHGVRGNENRTEGREVICDYCSARLWKEAGIKPFPLTKELTQ